MAACPTPAINAKHLADAVRTAARAGAPDRYVAALLAPRAARDDLIVLAGFAAELDKISNTVREPHLGAIRLQWWRDALAAGVPTRHPVCDALSATLSRHGIVAGDLDDLFDAQAHALYADAPEDAAHLALSLDMTEGTLFKLCARVAGADAAQLRASEPTLHHAAQAYGLTRLALRLPYALRMGRMPLPATFAPNDASGEWRAGVAALVAQARQHLQQVRSAYAAEPASVRLAILPVALVEPYLRALSAPAHLADRDIAEIAPLTRTWRLAKTHVLSRL